MYAPMVYWTYLVHMQHSMPAVRQCKAHAKARGSEITLKHKVIQANQRPEEKWKWPNYVAGLLNGDNHNGAAQRAPMESVAIRDAKVLCGALWQLQPSRTRRLSPIGVSQDSSCLLWHLITAWSRLLSDWHHLPFLSIKEADLLNPLKCWTSGGEQNGWPRSLSDSVAMHGFKWL